MMDIMLPAKALKRGSVREWPACLRLCGIIPKGAVNVIGMGEDSRWSKRCKEMNRIPRSWLLQPQEHIEDLMMEMDTLGAAGEKSAEQDKHPWEVFVMCLHNKFKPVTNGGGGKIL